MEAWERRRPNTRATVPCRPHSAQRPCPTETLRTPLRLNPLCAPLCHSSFPGSQLHYY